MNPAPRRSGFSLLELAILVAVIAIIAAVLLPVLANRQNRRPPGLKCVNNLKNVGLAFRIYATDNNDQLPGLSLASNAPNLASIKIADIYQLLSNELSTPKILVCPADPDRVEASDFSNLTSKNISYFTSLTAVETKPASILGGDRNILINGKLSPGLVSLTTNTPVSWSKAIHNERGNLIMSDGSFQQADSPRLKTMIRDQQIATNHLIFP